MQYIYTMIGVSKIVPPKREIIKDISLSFFPGAKIGLLGLNGSGKSTVLRIMAGVDTDFHGEARPQPGIKIGYLEQEPQLDPEHTVREAVEEGVGEVLHAQAALDEVYAAYAEEDADFDKLAAEQQRLEAILATGDAAHARAAAGNRRRRAAPAAVGREDRHAVRRREAPRRAVPPAAAASPTCCCSTNRPTTSTPNRSSGWSSSSPASPAPWSRSPTIATSSTTPPSGSSSSTAAAAFRGRATTPTG